ncbi:XisI protein [Roseofilum sp. BLCC_M91]|uniref:XisI protein n=1 Tax=Roseofilum halophilum BLCC-M91 TaxID=3022259 RepID=A0ABT7BGM0_9CYAN|nr:XisI protein [Roseofilum halophilum]MDJ1178220.1 XisI protein [Roseofilum halophilum BLCC-M91]
MDTATLRDIVKQVISQYARLTPSHGEIRLDTVFDETQNRYALMQTGWSQGCRVRGNLIYITLQDERIYLEYDGMEQGITQDLLDLGVPSDQIVLAFLPEEPLALAG